MAVTKKVTPKPKASPAKGERLVVTAQSARFRRAGLRFTRQPTELSVKDLTKAQIEALESEPRLSVKRLPAEAAE